MRRRVKITLITAAALLLVAVAVIFVGYRAGALDWWFERQLRSQLAEMNIRLAVTKASVTPYPGLVVLEGLQLYPGEDQTPFVSVERLTVKFDITSLWARTAEVRSMEIVRPVVNIRFDEAGRSNLDVIDWPETPKEATRPTEQLSYQMATLAIEDGQVNYGDAVRRISGTADDVVFSLVPKGEKQADGAPPARRLELTFANSKFTYEGREVAEIAGAVGADVTREGATVDRLDLTSPLGTTNAAGTIRNWEDPEYDFQIGSTVVLERVGYVADPNAGLTGRAAINGRLTGKGMKYTFRGELSSPDLLVAGVRIAGLKASAQPLQGERLDYAWMGELIASRLTLPGLFDASGIRFRGGAKGHGANATAEGDFTADRLAGEEFTATGVSFDGSVDVAARAASGQVGVASLALRTVRVGNVRAEIVADGDRVDVARFTAGVYGGTVSGSASARLDAGGTSSLQAEFRGVDLDQALDAASSDAPRVDGRASGRVSLTWPGANVRAASGTVRATVAGSLPGEEGAEGVPLEGEIALTAVPGRFRIDTAEFRSGESRITATGTIGWDRRSDIAVTAEAPDGSQLLTLVTAANPAVGKAIADAKVELAGAFRFEGQVTGSLTNPDLAGRVEVGRIAIEGEELGAFTGGVRREAGVLKLEEGVLRRSDGGEVAFDLSVPSRETDSQTIVARITRYPVQVLAKIVPAAPLQQIGGTLSGTVDITVPQGGRAFDRMLGRVDLAVEGATIQGEPVRELRFVADLDPARIALSEFRLDTARGSLTGSASFDKGSGVYRADFQANNVDLKVFEPAGTDGPPPVSLSGTASGPLSIVGHADLEKLKFPVESVTADIAGSDVTINGEAVGAARLTVETAAEGGEKIALVRFAGDVRGERRELAGTIYVARTDFPFRFATSLAEADVTRLVAVPPEGVTTRVTGDLEVRGFLADLANPDGVAERLQLTGRFSDLALMVEVDTAGKRYELSNRGDVVFNSSEGVLHFEKSTFVGEGTELTLAGDLAIEPEAESNLTLAGDVNLALASSFSRDTYAAGIASIQASVAGTLADPRFSGFADVRDASLRVVDLPIALQNGNGRILFTANQALIDSFTAQSNGGRVRVDGGVLFAGLRPERWRFGFDAEQIRVNYPEDVRSIIDGRFTLQGNEQLQVLAGAVNVRRAEFTRDVDINDLLSLEEEQGRGSFAAGTGTGQSRVRLDLTVEARDSLIIRNNLADVVASASLALTGPADDPIIDGRATLTRGTVNFRNGEYQVSRGVVRFPGRLGGDITFDLQAESEIRGYRVTIGLSGTPDKPYPVLRSEPPLPETQIVSLILTGDLGADEVTTGTLGQSGVGLASSLLSEAVSRSVEQRTSRLFGINRFQIDPLVGGANPSARITLGRQVNKNLSILYSTNVTSGEEQVIQIEYRISDRFSVVATRDERGAYGVDFRVRKRF